MRTALDLDLIVDAAEPITPTIRSLALRRADGGPLPSYVPGSHLFVECGVVCNAYSLTGAGRLPEVYTISVLRLPSGRGGSQWLHEAAPGARVRASAPRSSFPPVANAKAHLMIAGGVGVTPFLSHLKAAKLLGRSVTLLYGVGRDAAVPHSRELDALTGGQVQIARGREALRAQADALLRRQPIGAHLYVCGPQGMIEQTLAQAQALGWPAARCHFERFGGLGVEAGPAFDVRLARAGQTIAVPPGATLLEALEAGGIAWPSMCRAGVCGECRMEGAHGDVDHRDLVLSAAERAAGGFMPCVSRARGLLVVDL